MISKCKKALLSTSRKHGFFADIMTHKYAYILILPALILVTVFSYLPLTGIVLAFKDFNIVQGIFGSPWVGLDNFKEIFMQPKMLHAIKNTLIYGCTILFGFFPFPIILALLFNEIRNIHFKKIVQTISYMPHFLSWISVIGLFSVFLAKEGPFNMIMGKLFGEAFGDVNLLMDPAYFLPIIFISHIWKSVGWSSVIFLAAIAGIDPTLYEAASVDGCGKLRQAWHITLPSIRGTALIVLIMSLGTLFNTNFEQVYGFQNVYTQEQTEVINTLIYRQGIENGQYSLATAFGLSQGLVSVTILLAANAISKRLFEISIW